MHSMQMRCPLPIKGGGGSSLRGSMFQHFVGHFGDFAFGRRGALDTRGSSSSGFFSPSTLHCPLLGFRRSKWRSSPCSMFFVVFNIVELVPLRKQGDVLCLLLGFRRSKGRSSPCSVFILVFNIFELVPSRKKGGGKLAHCSFVHKEDGVARELYPNQRHRNRQRQLQYLWPTQLAYIRSFTPLTSISCLSSWLT